MPLERGEYYHEKVKKTTITLHHTAGSHRPDYTINGWEKDKDKAGNILKVATAYVIGGRSTTGNDDTWDGIVVEAFPPDCWAHHLGLKHRNNLMLNRCSIAIELTNYGPLKLGKDGQFYNYVNKPVFESMVVKLEQPFRGFQYYHAYTEAQIQNLRKLMLELANIHSIDLRAGIQPFLKQGASGFEINQAALKGLPGVWSHTNMRSDKFDISPQPAIIEMLLSL